MGLGHSPQIVTNGMVLCLDAANPKNYNLTEVEVLVVAGGGAGGNGTGSGYESGGGGAGGLIYSSSHPITPGSAITATVGAGGASGTSSSNGANGANSVFGALTAIGGGGGATAPAGGSSGGSGGGGSHNQTAGGSGTAGQGFSGATPAQGSSGGGGGGAGGPGKSTSSNADGSGGIGLAFSISGSLQYYAGGGGGSRHTNVSGGLGGGGAGVSLSAGYANGSPGGTNTGGGGGGANQPATNTGGGAGGSGIIIVRYPGSQKATGGTVTFVGGHTIHTFTTSGTFTPNGAPGTGTIWTDFSNNGNSGTLVNGVGYSAINRGSLTFDGTNQKVTFPNNTISTTAGITVDVWFKTSSGTKYQDIFDLDDSFGVWITTNYNSSGKITASFNTTNGIMSADYVANNWYQVVISGSGTSNTLYVNGVSVATASQTVATSINLNTARIGNVDGDRAAEYLVGNVASVKVYNRALTAAEVSQNFNALRGRFGI